MQQTLNGIADGEREQPREDEFQEQQKRTNERIRRQIEQAQKSLDRQAELIEQARQQRQQQDDRDRQQQTALRSDAQMPHGQESRRLVIRNSDGDEGQNKQQNQQHGQHEQRETQDAPRAKLLQEQPEPNAMPLDDAAAYALRRDEEHLDRQDQLGSMIDESSDPVERERLTLVKDAEHHAYSADQIDRILEMQTRLDRMAGTNVSSSPEFERLRERGTEHRAALGDTMQALERHNAQHPPNGRPQASTPSETTPQRSTNPAPSEAPSPRSPRPNFAERAAARRTAAEAQGATMPPREHSTPAASASASHAPALARTTDATRGRSR